MAQDISDGLLLKVCFAVNCNLSFKNFDGIITIIFFKKTNKNQQPQNNKPTKNPTFVTDFINFYTSVKIFIIRSIPNSDF